jgi:hypothetical protein
MQSANRPFAPIAHCKQNTQYADPVVFGLNVSGLPPTGTPPASYSRSEIRTGQLSQQ